MSKGRPSARDMEIFESIMRGMKNVSLPDVACSVCGDPIEYVHAERAPDRIVSLWTKCPCGHSTRSILGI